MCVRAKGAGETVGDADNEGSHRRWQLLVQTKVIGASEGIRVGSDTELRVLFIARNGEILCVPESSSTGGKGAT